MVVALAAAPASADIGVALNVGRIDVNERLLPGGAYELPTMRVRNPGTVKTSYRMVVSSLPGEDRLAPDREWLSFSPAEIKLKPGQSAPVRVRMRLPSGAEPGDYEGLIAAQIVSKGKGPQVGAAAAARLTFTVGSSGWLDSLWRRLKRFFSENAPQSWALPLAGGLVFGGWQFRRRYGITVTRKP